MLSILCHFKANFMLSLNMTPFFKIWLSLKPRSLYSKKLGFPKIFKSQTKNLKIFIPKSKNFLGKSLLKPYSVTYLEFENREIGF